MIIQCPWLRMFLKCSIINVAFQNNEGKNEIFQTSSHSQQLGIKFISIDHMWYDTVHMDSRFEMFKVNHLIKENKLRWEVVTQRNP